MSTTPALFPELAQTVSKLNLESVTAARREILQPLVDFIRLQTTVHQPIRLNFICTHNSRRSHLSQVWAQTAAAHFNIENVFCCSGGTAATALFPMVRSTLAGQGFKVDALSQEVNPVYAIKFAPNEPPVVAFSKTYDHNFNPENAFAAIMTCSQADDGCPFIPGATQRIPVTYDDPKAFDDSPLQAQKYEERSLQIATEMFYVFSQIRK